MGLQEDRDEDLVLLGFGGCTSHHQNSGEHCALKAPLPSMDPMRAGQNAFWPCVLIIRTHEGSSTVLNCFRPQGDLWSLEDSVFCSVWTKKGDAQEDAVLIY